MSKRDILEWYTNNTQSLSIEKITFVLAMSLVVGAIIFITYRIAYKGVCYNAGFNLSNIVLVLISTTIMLMISSNIAISLGMVGALSIVRFRTAIKDPQDTIYIFWSIIEGLCTGAQLYKLSIISSLIIATILLCGSFYESISRKYLIVLRGSSFSQDEAQEILKKHYKNSRLRSCNCESLHMEIVCEVTSKYAISSVVTSELQKIDGVKGVDWLLETGGHVG